MKLEKLNPPAAEFYSFIFDILLYFRRRLLPFLQSFYILDETSGITKMRYLHYDSTRFTSSVCYDFHFYSPEAIGVWSLSSGERPKEKIQLILLILSKIKSNRANPI
jgi:hypothetical protein